MAPGIAPDLLYRTLNYELQASLLKGVYDGDIAGLEGLRIKGPS